MPAEGSIQRIAADLTHRCGGKTLQIASPQGRFAGAAKNLRLSRLEEIRRLWPFLNMMQRRNLQRIHQFGEYLSLSREILEQLKSRTYSERDMFAVRLCFEAAFVNAAVHGNRQDASKDIIVEWMVSDRHVAVSVTDEGNGFDANSLPDPTEGENRLLDHGRGVYLIRQYMDRVSFSNAGRTVAFEPGRTQ